MRRARARRRQCSESAQPQAPRVAPRVVDAEADLCEQALAFVVRERIGAGERRRAAASERRRCGRRRLRHRMDSRCVAALSIIYRVMTTAFRP